MSRPRVLVSGSPAGLLERAVQELLDDEPKIEIVRQPVQGDSGVEADLVLYALEPGTVGRLRDRPAGASGIALVDDGRRAMVMHELDQVGVEDVVHLIHALGRGRELDDGTWTAIQAEKRALECRAAIRRGDGDLASLRDLEVRARVASNDAPLGRIGRRLRLTRLECRMLIALVLQELDPIDVQPERGHDKETGSNGLSVTDLVVLTTDGDAQCEDAMRSLGPTGQLVRFGLIQAHAGPSGTRRFSAGIGLSERLVGLDVAIPHAWMCTEPFIAECAAQRLEDVGEALASVAPSDVPLMLNLFGPGGAGRRAAAAGAASRSPLRIDLCSIASATVSLLHALSSVACEAVLNDRTLWLEGCESLEPARLRAVLTELSRWQSRRVGPGELRVVLFSGSPLDPAEARSLPGLIQIEFGVLSAEERRSYLRARCASWDVSTERIDSVAEYLAATVGDLDDLASVAESLARGRQAQSKPSEDDLREALRARSTREVGGLAERLECSAKWSDLVLPDELDCALRELVAQVENRHLVMVDWGFEALPRSPTGMAALFSGPSGTGKTLAAEVVGTRLGRDLLRVELSGVLSKYIGETEKNLDLLFREAEVTGAVLLFDEADALFARRSEVRSSNDRYANSEVAYLLQRVERFRGLTILTTNLRQNMDEAFLRRLQFVLDFPSPDEALRSRLWRCSLPRDVPKDEGIDYTGLARMLRLTGGSIRNAALAAAFEAAREGGAPISQDMLVRAAAREAAKVGLPLRRAGLRPSTSVKGGVA